MIRRSLYAQVFLAFFVATFVPFFGVIELTTRILKASVAQQVQAGHKELANAGSALVRDYLKDATTKLKSIAQMVRKDQDPQEQTRRLNALLDPPDIFLEVGYWTVGKKEAEVQAQAQQEGYNLAQNTNRLSSRSFNQKVKQQVQTLSNDSPILVEPSNGNTFIGKELDNVGDFNGLPISVPAPSGGVLTATVDFKPIFQILQNLTSLKDFRVMTLSDAAGREFKSPFTTFDANEEDLSTSVDVGHAGWRITVREARFHALKPFDDLNEKIWYVWLIPLVLSQILAGLLTRRILKPIKVLGKTADALRKGDLSARTGVTRQDEIGQLAQAFDRMAAAVQEIDQVKGEFVAHVSHELRTPLTSAKVTLANVQEGIGGTESLGRVQEDLDRLIRMVNELLDVARIDAGIALAKQRCDLGALVRSAVETLRPLARVPLDVTGTGDTLDLDAARVQQIVLNLVDNALKYAKSRVDVELRGREVRVTDDGPGVPAEHRERIFEKFSKVETGPKPPGAGLGLSIARKLAQLHGGSLVCEGNTFVLRF